MSSTAFLVLMVIVGVVCLAVIFSVAYLVEWREYKKRVKQINDEFDEWRDH